MDCVSRLSTGSLAWPGTRRCRGTPVVYTKYGDFCQRVVPGASSRRWLLHRSIHRQGPSRVGDSTAPEQVDVSRETRLESHVKGSACTVIDTRLRTSMLKLPQGRGQGERRRGGAEGRGDVWHASAYRSRASRGEGLRLRWTNDRRMMRSQTRSTCRFVGNGGRAIARSGTPTRSQELIMALWLYSLHTTGICSSPSCAVFHVKHRLICASEPTKLGDLARGPFVAMCSSIPE